MPGIEELFPLPTVEQLKPARRSSDIMIACHKIVRANTLKQIAEWLPHTHWGQTCQHCRLEALLQAETEVSGA